MRYQRDILLAGSSFRSMVGVSNRLCESRRFHYYLQLWILFSVLFLTRCFKPSYTWSAENHHICFWSHRHFIDVQSSYRLTVTPNRDVILFALHLLFQLNSCTPDEFYCWQMLEETGITPIAGTHFGQKEGTHHFRSGHFIYVDKAVAGWTRQ